MENKICSVGHSLLTPVIEENGILFVFVLFDSDIDIFPHFMETMGGKGWGQECEKIMSLAGYLSNWRNQSDNQENISVGSWIYQARAWERPEPEVKKEMRSCQPAGGL